MFLTVLPPKFHIRRQFLLNLHQTDASHLEAIKVIVLVTDWFIRASSVVQRTFIDRCLSDTEVLSVSLHHSPSSFSLRVEHNFESETTRVNYSDTIRHQSAEFAQNE